MGTHTIPFMAVEMVACARLFASTDAGTNSTCNHSHLLLPCCAIGGWFRGSQRQHIPDRVHREQFIRDQVYGPPKMRRHRSVSELEYNGLYDPTLKNYFSKPSVREHLLNKGFVTKDGQVLGSTQELHHFSKVRLSSSICCCWMPFFCPPPHAVPTLHPSPVHPFLGWRPKTNPDSRASRRGLGCHL